MPTYNRDSDSGELLSPQLVGLPLQKHSLGLLLACSYAFLALISWSLTAILVYRPLTRPSYGLVYPWLERDVRYTVFDANIAFDPTRSWQLNDRSVKPVQVMTAIASVLAIPITAAICARGAVVLTQKGHTSLALTLRRTLALADRGWTDILILGSLLSPKGWRRYGSWYLTMTAALCGLGAIIFTSSAAAFDRQDRLGAWGSHKESYI